MNILKYVNALKEGAKLYSPLFKEVELVGVDPNEECCIKTKAVDKTGTEYFVRFDALGRHYPEFCGECVLFPSKENRDWETIPLPIPDKALVWAWDNNDGYIRCLRFYDAINKTTFNTITNARDGAHYDNYELFEGTIEPWMTEAAKQLKD